MNTPVLSKPHVLTLRNGALTTAYVYPESGSTRNGTTQEVRVLHHKLNPGWSPTYLVQSVLDARVFIRVVQEPQMGKRAPLVATHTDVLRLSDELNLVEIMRRFEFL